MKQKRLSLKDIQSEFLNVDLEVKSRADTAPLLRALGKRVICLYLDRIGRRHWLRLTLARQPKTPVERGMGGERQGGASSRHVRRVHSVHAVFAAARCGRTNLTQARGPLAAQAYEVRTQLVLFLCPPIVHKHMPELLQVLEHLRMGAPVAPQLRLPVQRGLSGSDDRCVQHAIAARNASRETRHLWATKIIWHVGHAEAKSGMPVQSKVITRGELPQQFSSRCRRERRIGDKQLDILLQRDRAVDLRLDLGVEHTP